MKLLKNLINIWAVIKKNLLRIKSSKISLLIILLGPLLLISIIGVAFNTSQLTGIKISVYSESYPEYANNIIENIKLNQDQFSIWKTETYKECELNVKNGESHICLFFPKDSSKKTIKVYVDYSRINLVWTLLDIMNSKFKKESTDISKELSNKIISELTDTQNLLKEKSSEVSNLNNDMILFDKKISVIDQMLNQINFTIPNASFNSELLYKNNQFIDEAENNAYAQIDSYKDSITDAQVFLDSSLDMIVEEKESQLTLIDQLNNTYDVMNCKNGIDLSPYLYDEDFGDMIYDIESPECSFVLTIISKLKDSVRGISDTENKILELNDQVDNIQDSLDDYENNLDDFFSASKDQINVSTQVFENINDVMLDAKEKSNDLMGKKNSLKVELSNVKSLVGNSKSVVDAFNMSFNLIVNNLDSVTKINPNNIVSPFDIQIKAVSSKSSTLEYLFPTLFILIIMFVSVLLGITIVNQEKNSRAYFRNFITPTKNYILILGNFITCSFITTIQVLIIGLLGSLIFNVELSQGFGLILSTLIATTIFSLLGLLVGYIINSEETTTLTGIIICIILFLFSSTIIPIESMNSLSKIIVQFNPFFILESLFRKQIIFNMSLFTQIKFLFKLFIEIIMLILGIFISWFMIRKKL